LFFFELTPQQQKDTLMPECHGESFFLITAIVFSFKEQLLSMVLQGLNAPITGLVGVLTGVTRKFVYAIDAIAKKKAEEE